MRFDEFGDRGLRGDSLSGYAVHVLLALLLTHKGNVCTVAWAQHKSVWLATPWRCPG